MLVKEGVCMNLMVNVCNKYVAILDCETMKAITLIDADFGLARYMCMRLFQYEISKNKAGYLQMENIITGEVLLHRIILQYFSKFNIKLYTTLTNSEYEVNHINKNVWDNRLENLEIVTKKGNRLHRQGLAYCTEVVMTSQDLIRIMYSQQETRMYKEDIKYLENKSKINIELLLNEKRSKIELFKYPYLIFNNYTLMTQQNTLKHIDSNNLEAINNKINPYFFRKFIENNTSIYIDKLKHYNCYIADIIIEYNYFRCSNIIYYNISVLENLFKKNLKYLEPLRTVLKKYNLVNIYYTSYKEELLKLEDYYNNNVLIDLLKSLPSPFKFSLYKNNLLFTCSIKTVVTRYKRYEPLKVAYFLGLLNRLPSTLKKSIYTDKLKLNTSNYLNEPSFIKVPIYTKELINKANEQAKQLLKQSINKYTHFIIKENFGEEKADTVFKSKKCKKNTSKAERTKEDLKTIISNTFKNKIEKEGFITINEILGELKKINSEKRNQGLEYNTIADGTKKFISSALQNVPDIKKILQELGLKYILHLNEKTIDKIRKYQKKNNTNTVEMLKVRHSAIVSKKLVEKRR